MIIGRIGDLIVGDHLGQAHPLLPRLQVPAAQHQHGVAVRRATVVHQTALYDFLLTIPLLLLLL